MFLVKLPEKAYLLNSSLLIFFTLFTQALFCPNVYTPDEFQYFHT